MSEDNRDLTKRRFIEEIVPFVLIIACIVVARFSSSIPLLLTIFGVALVIYIWRGYDARFLVLTAVFLLVIYVILLTSAKARLANNVAIWAYYFLVIGVVGLFIECLRKWHEE